VAAAGGEKRIMGGMSDRPYYSVGMVRHGPASSVRLYKRRPMPVPHFTQSAGRWTRRNPDGTVDVMPSGWRPGVHSHDVK
jgi:hypothetical protein